jgi:RNA polymerase sigma-70 factor (ECF subfamily)
LTLIVGLQRGDEEAWRRMIDLYSPLVYGWCRRWGLPPEDACDVSQETFRAAAAAIGGFRSNPQRGTFRGWLRQIARRKTIDWWRRRGAEPTPAAGGSQVQTLLAQTPDPWGEEEEENDADSPAELAGVVRRALDFLHNEFEPPTWRAFWEMAVEGRPASDVGAELGLTANAVRVAKCKVLRRLREELGEHV